MFKCKHRLAYLCSCTSRSAATEHITSDWLFTDHYELIMSAATVPMSSSLPESRSLSETFLKNDGSSTHDADEQLLIGSLQFIELHSKSTVPHHILDTSTVLLFVLYTLGYTLIHIRGYKMIYSDLGHFIPPVYRVYRMGSV